MDESPGPGPGSYNLPNFMGEGPKYKISDK